MEDRNGESEKGKRKRRRAEEGVKVVEAGKVRKN